MTKSKQDVTTTSTSSRFGGSVYRPKSRSFPKDSSTEITKTSEFTLNDAISPISSTTTTTTNTTTTRNHSRTGENEDRDLLAEISFDDSRNHISIYESVTTSSSTNSSFDTTLSGSPTRYPQSKHVSFDGSNISSDPASPDKRGSSTSNSSHHHSSNGNRRVVTPDRIVSMSPILANDQQVSRMSSTSSASIDDESDATVPTSNLVLTGGAAAAPPRRSLPSKPTPSMDETSVTSSISYDEFGVARNAYETSTFTKNGSTKPTFVTTNTNTATTSTTTKVSSSTISIPLDESTKPIDANRATSATSPALMSIEEQTKDTITTSPQPRKASWMTFLRPLNTPESEEKVEDQPVTPEIEADTFVWKKSRPFEIADMYQDPKEITPVLFMVESKRQCWFQKEMDAIRREWQYYKKLIRDNVQEVIRVEDMLRSSYDGLCDYVKHMDDMIADRFVNEQGELLSKRDKSKMMKRRSDATSSNSITNNENADDDADDETKDLNLWLTPMIASFSQVQGEIKTQLPLLEECLMDVVSLKQEMRGRGKELDEKGNTLSLQVMEQAESNIQDAFDALMNVIDELERAQREEMRKAKAASARSTTSTTSDGVLREFLDETKSDDMSHTPMHDRWLYESQYRYAAKLGLLSWKENRKDYEFWYAEIIALHEERKCRLNEVLVSFLPRRMELLKKAHLALMAGSEAMDETMIPATKETRAIDRAIERNAVLAMKNDPNKFYTNVTMESILNFKTMKQGSSSGGGKGNGATKYARSSTDLWKSALIRERRLIELKVNKDEYKLAVAIVTLDDSMHIFVMTDDILHDNSSSTTINSLESSSLTKPLDYYTKRMSTMTTTKIPLVEYSIKLLDYDITIVGSGSGSSKNSETMNTKHSTNRSQNPFGSMTTDIKIPTEIELIRKTRSMIFRKRDDCISIRVPSPKDAMKFVRNRLPVGERLTEI